MPGPTREQKPRAVKLWEELVDEAGEDEIEAAANVSVEEATRELREAGFDLEDERAHAESFLSALETGGDYERAAMPVPEADQIAARELRARAAAALEAGKPGECLRLLDEARAKNPASDFRPDVKEMRERAKRAPRTNE